MSNVLVKFSIIFVFVYTSSSNLVAQDFGKYFSTFQQLLNILGTENHTPPRLSNEKTKPTLETITDAEQFLIPYQFEPNDLGNLQAMCGVANQLSVGYVLFDVGSEVNASDPQEITQRKILELRVNNFFRYQAEMTKVAPFLIWCLAKQIRPTEIFFDKLPPEQITPIRLQGLAQTNSGIEGIYLGFLSSVQDAKINSAYVEVVTTALVQTTPEFRRLMSKSTKQRILGWLSEVKALPESSSNHLGQLKHDILKIEKLLAYETCNLLCSLQTP
jgi:hypothetical protein